MMPHFKQIKRTGDGAAVIRVVGVGGAGNNIVNKLEESGVAGVEIIAANTDMQALKQSRAHRTVQLGPKLTEGLGAGSNPEVGRQAAEESAEVLQDCLAGSDMVFVVAGLGGGTGTGAAPEVARICREKLKALTVGVVCMPFFFEGRKRSHLARKGWDNLKKYTDTIITIENDRIFGLTDHNADVEDGFFKVNEVLVRAVRGISDIINTPGHINPDFADIKTIMAEQGEAFMGVGEGEGENRMNNALQQANDSPMLLDGGIYGRARGLLINVTCRKGEMTMQELGKMGRFCDDLSSRDTLAIFGLTYDDSLGGRIRVTMIATGIEKEKPRVDYGLNECRKVKVRRRSGSAKASRDQTTLPFGREGKEPMGKAVGLVNGHPVEDLDERDFDIPTWQRQDEN